MLCVFLFSFAIFQLIKMLRAFEVTGFVQILTTTSLSVMPHIFNMAALKTSEDIKEAWKEKLKLNVKYMVEELFAEDLKRGMELVQTEVIIPRQDENDQIFIQAMRLFQRWTNETANVNLCERFFKSFRKRKRTDREHDTTNDNDQDNEREELLLGEIKIHDGWHGGDKVNEEREELRQTKVMIHSKHDTTNEMTDDNDQDNEERVELPQAEIMIHHEHETTNEMTDGNDQNNEELVELLHTELMIHQEDDTTNEMTDDNDQDNEELVALLQTEVMIQNKHETTNEMRDENHGVFGRVLHLFHNRKRR